MKYFVLAKRNTVPLPIEQAAGMYQAAKQWVKAQLANGRFDGHYIFSELGGGFAITNADSHEEVTDSLLEYPLYPFFNWEVKPLSDWSHSYDKLAELFQRITK